MWSLVLAPEAASAQAVPPAAQQEPVRQPAPPEPAEQAIPAKGGQTPPAQAVSPDAQAAPRPGAAAAGQVFRSGVELVSLTVTVTDREKNLVTGLAEEDFSVFEDGMKQEVTFFTSAQVPIALALLLDTSASMEQKLETAQEAAVGFARRLRPQDLASVIDFDSRVMVLQDFTADGAAVEQAIRSTTPGGSTSLHNAIYIALTELKKQRARSVEDIRRRAIVVLSDGEDTSSLLPFEEVLELAKRSETAIYAIGLRPKEPRPQGGFREAEYVLRTLAQETGGRAFFPMGVSELPAIYTQIAQELANQYTLGYSSKNIRRDGRWRAIVVRVARPDAIARTKAGYYAPGR
jgi:Ca-activated chloride channel family protein